MEARLMRGLAAAVIAVLSAALIAGLFLPVYTDEIGWRFQERAGFDGVDKMFSEVCGLSSLVKPPWFMMPARWYSSAFNGAFADPFWIRISGIGYALAWIALTLLLLRRLTADRQVRAVGATVGLGLLALGTMPLLMVWSRPEQPIMLAVVGVLLIAIADGATGPRPASTARQAWTRSLAVFALGCIVLAYHVKGLFLLPLMLVCLVLASRGARAHLPRIVAGLLILATTASATSYWRHRLECQDSVVLAKAYASQSLASSVTKIASPGDAFALIIRLIENMSIFKYLIGITPRVDPLSAWIPLKMVSEETSNHWFAALVIAWGAALFVAAAALVLTGLRDWRERRIDLRIVLALTTFGVAMAWSATQTYRNVYEAKFILPMLVLAILLALSTVRPGRFRAALPALAAAIGLFAVVSPIAVGAIYAPSLLRAAGQSGYIDVQPFSVSVFGYAKVRRDIEAAAKLCRLPDPARAQAVMVDDATYFAFIHSRLPQHQLGVVGGWNGDITDPMGYLRAHHSDGAVVACKQLKGDLRARAKASGDICCLEKP